MATSECSYFLYLDQCADQILNMLQHQAIHSLWPIYRQHKRLCRVLAIIVERACRALEAFVEPGRP